MTLKEAGCLERGEGPCWQEVAISNRVVREGFMEMFFEDDLKEMRR